jgi:hypothetical protein
MARVAGAPGHVVVQEDFPVQPVGAAPHGTHTHLQLITVDLQQNKTDDQGHDSAPDHHLRG